MIRYFLTKNKMSRNNFSKKTIETLAQRVGYLCSNPACKIHTIGPNTQLDKTTKIGEAAHISAAANGGPRYDPLLSVVERSGIDNGIWLCSNCADLIDKDERRYSVKVLKAWKVLAEIESAERIKAMATSTANVYDGPYLEAVLIKVGGMRINEGYSDKNPGEVEDGVYVIDISHSLIIHWVLTWKLKLVIYNNSAHPAYNVKVIPVSDIQTIIKETLPDVNNLQAFDKVVLKLTYQERVEDRHTEADRRLAMRIPEGIYGSSFEITYLDDKRRPHRTLVNISGQQIQNEKV
jgi:hypothetical protein